MPTLIGLKLVFTLKRLVMAALLYALLGFVPPSPFEKPLFVLRLSMQEPPARLPIPVAGASSRNLRDSWGAPRSGGRSHQGIDIFAPRGTPVLATTQGLIWKVGQDPLGGQVVWVLGPGRQLHYYAHLDRFAAIRSGDLVREGDKLGYVGTTGNARGAPPHLHYGIYVATQGAINPYPLLTPAAQATR